MKVIYTAIVLNHDDQDKLKLFVAPYKSKKYPVNIYCHHRTLKYGNQELPSNLGAEVVVKLTDVFCRGDVACVATTDGGHITIFTEKGVPPKTSNDIVNKEQYRVGECYVKEVRGRVMAYVVDDDDELLPHWI